MPRGRSRKELHLRIAEAAILTILSGVGVSLAWRFQPQQPLPPPLPKGIPRYDLSLVDGLGRALSISNNPIKAVLSPDTFARLAPNQHLPYFNTDERGNRVTTDQPSGVPIAVVLGGSAAMGYGADSDSDTLVSALQRLKPQWKWINMGMSGFASGEELAQMVFQADSLHPSLYVDFSGFNDYKNTVFLSRSSQLFSRSGFFLLQVEERFAGLLGRPPTSYLAVTAPHESAAVSRKRVESYEENLLRMRDFANARGAKFFLALQPEAPPEGRGPSNSWLGPKSYSGSFVPKIVEFCRKERMSCMDLNPATRVLNDGAALFIDRFGVHLRREGNEFMAREIAKQL